MHLEQNIVGLCENFGVGFDQLLNDFEAGHVYELTIYDLEAIAEEYEVDMYALLFKNMFRTKELQKKIDRLKLIILYVDGVMTDGGMYFAESGDQFKKFNTKDGMAITHLTDNGFQLGIISSGFKGEAVKQRAEMLGIQNCYVGRAPKMNILQRWCSKMNITLAQVGIIGDDINDMELMRNAGVSFCPSNAVDAVKNIADVVLCKKGGDGCVREMIDEYILKEPLTK